MSQTRKRKGFLASSEGVERLKEKKFEKRYTYEQITSEAHVTSDQVKRLFNPHWNYKVGEEAIEAIARVLDLQPTDIVDLNEWNPPPNSEPEPPLSPDIIIYDKQFIAFKRIIDIIKDQKNKEIDVITISANNYDIFIKVDKIYPEHESVIMDEPFPCAGGSGANTVCGLSKLGKKTAIVGCVKNDFEGQELIKSFDNFFVDREFFIIKNEPTFPNHKTGTTLVLVEKSSGKRQILVTPGINNCLSEIFRANNEELLEKLVEKIKRSKILHLSSFAGQAEMQLQLTVLTRIWHENIIVSLTPGAIYVAEGLNGLNRILGRTNIMFLYTQQLEQLLERSKEIDKFERHLSVKKKAEMFFEWRVQKQMDHPMILVIKDYPINKLNNVSKNYICIGSNFKNQGSFFKHQSKIFNQQDITLIPEDTTGTGDALVAGFLYGILKGEDIEKCTEFGFIMSIDASQQLGTRSNFPNESLLRAKLTTLTK